MNTHKFNTLVETYRQNLTKAVCDFPDEYPWYACPTIIHGNTGTIVYQDTIATVVERMAEAFRRGSFSKDGRAIRATLKALGIKPTYKAIREYLEQ